MKFIIHYGLHFIFPAIAAYLLYKNKWKAIYLVFIATMFVDLDHLLANPIFEANRCSINFHPFHTYIAIGFYVLGVFFKKTRVICIGLLLHMLADSVDCFF
jgi:hypothetical protein